MKTWVCEVCGYEHQGGNPPAVCPVCGVDSSQFTLMLEGKELKSTKDVLKKGVIFSFFYMLLKKHLHPISVHFPNGVLPVVVVLYLLSFFLNNNLFAKVAFINCFAVLLVMPVVFVTGISEWKIKYEGKFSGVFPRKIIFSVLTLLLLMVNLFWFVINPLVLQSKLSILFLLINFLMLLFAILSGHLGGKLVFKD